MLHMCPSIAGERLQEGTENCHCVAEVLGLVLRHLQPVPDDGLLGVVSRNVVHKGLQLSGSLRI